MTPPDRVPSFAPFDPTDGRSLLEWESKYTSVEARQEIRSEARYLAGLLTAVPLLMLLVWLGIPGDWLGLTPARNTIFTRYALSWLSGTLGGTLFDIKWFYHTVARRIWHMDRRLWRLFTPHLSGGLSFAVLALVTSGVVRIFDAKALSSGSAIVGLGFLVGYFSDSAIAKLSEIADTVFGVSRPKSASKPSSDREASESKA